MKLSIVIPAYNSEKYIADCLDSILISYDKDNFEVIIVNDGSTDNTLSICNEYMLKYNNIIKLFNIKNHGVSYARNYGVNKSTGDYVMFVDSDDCLCEDWYQKIFKNNYKEDVIYINKYLDDNVNQQYLFKCILGLNSSRETISAPFSKLFKLDFLKKNNLYFNKNVINGEDMLFNISVLLNTNYIYILKDNIYKYRINPNSISNVFKEKIIENDLVFQKTFKKLVENNSDFHDYIYFKRIDGIITLCRFISYLDKFEIAKKYFKKIYISPYIDVENFDKINFKKKILVKLFLNKNFFLIFYLNKFFNNFKRKKMKNYEYFIDV